MTEMSTWDLLKWDQHKGCHNCNHAELLTDSLDRPHVSCKLNRSTSCITNHLWEWNGSLETEADWVARIKTKASIGVTNG